MGHRLPTGQEVTIRSASVDDVACILSIYAYYVESTAISFEIEVPSLDAFAERIAGTLEKYPYIVLEEGGEVRGFAYALSRCS